MLRKLILGKHQERKIADVRSRSDRDPSRPLDPEPAGVRAVQHQVRVRLGERGAADAVVDRRQRVGIGPDVDVVDVVVDDAEVAGEQDVRVRAGADLEDDRRPFDERVPDVLE